MSTLIHRSVRRSRWLLVGCIALSLGGIADAAPTSRTSYKAKKPPALPPAPVVDYQGQIDALKAQVTALQNQVSQQQSQLAAPVALSKHVTLQTVNGKPTVVVSAANLQVNNGLGSTDTTNGVGNIIIGYDENRTSWGSGLASNCSLGFKDGASARALAFGGGFLEGELSSEQACIAAGGIWSVDNKGGSHYLVVGPGHFYSTYAGIVAGFWNLSNAPYANVGGGGFNASSGFGSVVAGGVSNAAFGGTGCRTIVPTTAVNGVGVVGNPVACWPRGQGNPILAAAWTSVLGGAYNKAWGGQGAASTISGGWRNAAYGLVSSVSGGSANEAIGSETSVNGGSGNSAVGVRSSILGGVAKSAMQANQAIPAVQ